MGQTGIQINHITDLLAPFPVHELQNKKPKDNSDHCLKTDLFNNLYNSLILSISLFKINKKVCINKKRITDKGNEKVER